MTKKQKWAVKHILAATREVLTQDAQKAQKGQESIPGMNGCLHFLLKRLSEELMTNEQQQEMEAILTLHRYCLYPLLYPFPATEAAAEPVRVATVSEVGHAR